jgi:hypothetical protein
MFNGTDPAVLAVYSAAGREGRRLGRRFVGAEHLLLALASRPSPTGEALRACGLAPPGIEVALEDLGGLSAAVAADCRAAEALGIDLGGVLRDDATRASLLPTPSSHRILPLGWREARRRCARATPPIAGDAQRAYEAALYLALAHWHRWLSESHLAHVIVRWSRGGVFVADTLGVDRPAAVAVLEAATPPRHRVRRGHLRRAEALAV